MEQKTTSHVNEKVCSYTLEFSGTAIDFADCMVTELRNIEWKLYISARKK